jgi:hypothetical protein
MNTEVQQQETTVGNNTALSGKLKKKLKKKEKRKEKRVHEALERKQEELDPTVQVNLELQVQQQELQLQQLQLQQHKLWEEAEHEARIKWENDKIEKARLEKEVCVTCSCRLD